MKAEKKIYNLIIKTPHFKMFEVVCSYFDLSWRTPWDDAFAKYGEDMAVAIGDIRMPMQYGYGQVEAFKMDNWSRDFEIITYPEFEARFLNKTMNIKDCLTDLKTEAEQIRSDIGMAKQRLDWLVDMIEKSQQAEPEKKVWTVEDVYNEVRPEKQFNYMPDGSSVIENMPYKSYDIGKYYFYNDKHCEKVFAFGHLLTVAHWANEGSSSPNGSDYYSVHWSGNGFPAISVPNNHEHVLIFKSRYAYEKFASVHGVEDLLKTFFGIEEDVK